MGCKNKTSPWHLIGFLDGGNIEPIVEYRGETHRYTAVHVYESPFRDTNQNKDKIHEPG